MSEVLNKCFLDLCNRSNYPGESFSLCLTKYIMYLFQVFCEMYVCYPEI